MACYLYFLKSTEVVYFWQHWLLNIVEYSEYSEGRWVDHKSGNWFSIYTLLTTATAPKRHVKEIKNHFTYLQFYFY